MAADPILDWNAIALDAIKNDYDVGATPDQGGPGKSARALAIVHVAMYDALMTIVPRYLPYRFHGLALPGTSIEAAVATAAHDTLVALFPHQTSTFDAALAESLDGISGRAARQGTALGSRVARDILALRANDGADAPMDYTPGDQPGDYRPDPLHPDQMAIGPDWNNVLPFVIRSGDQFAAPPPPELTSQVYTDAFNEVKNLGADGVNSPTTRTADQTEIGVFWAYDGVPELGTPPRLYNQVTRVIAEQRHNSLFENARLFAQVNVAMQDVGVVVWTTKYEENFWRPITAVREADPGTGPTGLGDGNPDTIGDPNWTPLGAPNDNGGGTNFTPAFPAYSSGHAGFGSAVFGVLRNFYHTDNISFSFTSDEFNGVTRDAAGNVRPLRTRSYTSLSQAEHENADSRLYLGVHWRFDMDASSVQGQQVANYVSRHFGLPLPRIFWFIPWHRHDVMSWEAAPTNSVAAPASATDTALATTDFASLDIENLSRASTSAVTPSALTHEATAASDDNVAHSLDDALSAAALDSKLR